MGSYMDKIFNQKPWVSDGIFRFLYDKLEFFWYKRETRIKYETFNLYRN